MRIRTKLLLNAIVIFGGLSLVGGAGFWATHYVARLSMSLVENEAIPIAKLNQLENSVWDLWLRLTLHISVTDVPTMQQLTTEIEQLADQIPQQQKELETLYELDQAHSEFHLKLLQTFQTEWQEFYSVAQQVLALSQEFTKEDALQLILQKARPRYQTMIDFLRQQFQQHQQQMAQLRATAVQARQTAAITILAMTLIIGLVVLLLINRFGRLLLTPLLQINAQLKLLAQGQTVEESINYQGQDEVAEIVTSSRLLNESIKSTIARATTIADGDYTQEVTLLSTQDQLGHALANMTHQLRAVTHKNELADWLKTGQTQLHEQMSGDQTLVDLAHNIISFLTLYIEAQVGLFYWVNKDLSMAQEEIKLLASYAYTRRKNLGEEFAFSTGLVERAAREQNSIAITIETGLGETVPRHLLVVPVLYENGVKGVIALGKDQAFTDMQQHFLTQVMPTIGIAVNSIEARSKMQVLLQQTQVQATELQHQKEELQHQQVVLQTQTEELQSQAEELQSQTEELRHANEELEERSKAMERQQEEVRAKNTLLEKSQQILALKAQELERASKYKSEFLANMSHELRTPLNSMLILAQLLATNKAGNLDDKQVEYAQTIHSAGADLLTLINEILDLSKVEAGKVEIQLDTVSWSELLTAIEQKFRPLALEKKLTFALTLAPNLPATIITDEQRLKQVINNLLSNAFKFTTQGEVRLTIDRATTAETVKLSTPGNFLAVRVIDSGIGIPKDKQELVFEAFQQADGSTNRRYGGTGLGLTISRQLARLLGGDLHLASEDGHGSTFTCYLPETAIPTLASDDSVVIKSPPEVEEETPVWPTILDDRDLLKPEHKSLLIIEDDRKFSKILMELARDQQFKCLIAEDGKTGLQLAEEYQPRAIILDIGLPQINGWNVMEKLKHNPQTRHIPVQFMSAVDHRQEAKQMGAIGYLVKPISTGQVREAFTSIEAFLAKMTKRVLVVLDQPHSQEEIVALLSNNVLQLTIAMTSNEALQQLQTITFDGIIIEVALRSPVGLPLLESLRQTAPWTALPVIIYAQRELTEAETLLLTSVKPTLTLAIAHSAGQLSELVTMLLAQRVGPPETPTGSGLTHDKEEVLRDKKVLVVDDDTRNTFALVTILEDKEMIPLTAKHGKEALETLAQQPEIDIVLMDIMMPEMDGYEAIRNIRAQPRFQRLPIIALTAKAMRGDKAKCIEAGANDYLSKPVDTDKLVSLMRVWLY